MPEIKEDPRPECAESGRNESFGPAAGLVGTAAWFGMVAGLLELAGVLAHRTIDPRIWMDSLRTNHNFVWMIPVSNALLFTALGLLLRALERYQPVHARRIAWRLYPALAILVALLTIKGLALVANIILACGLGVTFGPIIERRTARLQRLVRLSLPILGGGLAALAVLWTASLATGERFALARLPAASPTASNVLFIVLDNVRAESLSLFGARRPTTPNLERIARRGIVFQGARSTAPWTLPSHASMFTGQWAHKLSVSWDRPLDRTYPTLAEYLGEQGYATAGFVGNTYYCNARYGLDRGFARYEDYYERWSLSPFEIIHSSGLGRGLLWSLGYMIKVEEGGNTRRKSAAMLNADLLRWLDSRRGERPFFAFLNYFDAHSPFIPPDGAGPRFGLCALTADEKIEILKRNQRLTEQRPLPDDGPAEKVESDAIGVLRDSYESCIASLDHQLGRLFAELDRRGLRENTLVVITADHGEHFKERGFLGHGMSLYDREVHVPLLFLPPSSRAVSRMTIKQPVSLRDLPATIVDLLDLEARSPFPGQSLAQFWDASTPGSVQPPAYVLSEVEKRFGFAPTPGIPATLGSARSLVADGKVYIQNNDRGEELYDLANDPLETRNLFDEKDHLAAEHFRNLLRQILRDPDPLVTASASRP